MYKHVHSSRTYNNQKVEPVQMSIKDWVNKQIMVPKMKNS